MSRILLFLLLIIAITFLGARSFQGSSPAPSNDAVINRPHLSQNYVRQLLAVGLRNPWRSSFDQLSGNFWTGGTELYFWKKTIYVRSSNLA